MPMVSNQDILCSQRPKAFSRHISCPLDNHRLLAGLWPPKNCFLSFFHDRKTAKKLSIILLAVVTKQRVLSHNLALIHKTRKSKIGKDNGSGTEGHTYQPTDISYLAVTDLNLP